MLTKEQKEKIQEELNWLYEDNFDNPIQLIQRNYASWLSSLSEYQREAFCTWDILKTDCKFVCECKGLYQKGVHPHNVKIARIGSNGDIDIDVAFGSAGRHFAISFNGSNRAVVPTMVQLMKLGECLGEPYCSEAFSSCEVVEHCADKHAGAIIALKRYLSLDWYELMAVLSDIVSTVIDAVCDRADEIWESRNSMHNQLLAEFNLSDERREHHKKYKVELKEV